ELFLPDGTTPTAAGYPATTDPRLWYPLNAGGALSTQPAFTLPALSTYGLGNSPPTLFWGPVFKNVDLAISKSFQVTEGSRVEFRADMLNAFSLLNINE